MHVYTMLYYVQDVLATALSGVCRLVFFSRSVTCIFIFLMVSFKERKLSILMKSNL